MCVGTRARREKETEIKRLVVVGRLTKMELSLLHVCSHLHSSWWSTEVKGDVGGGLVTWFPEREKENRKQNY